MPDVDPTHYRLNDLKLRWRQDPSSRLFLQLADEHRKLGEHAEAVAVLEQGLEHRPNDLSALVALGRCRLDLELADEAIEPLETVVSRDPTHIVASKLLIEAHLQRGDVEKAGDRLRTYRLLNDRDPELNHLEYRLQKLQDAEEQEAPTVAGGELAGEPDEIDAEAAGDDGSAPAAEDVESQAADAETVEAEERSEESLFVLEPEPEPDEVEVVEDEVEVVEDDSAEPMAASDEPEPEASDLAEPELAEAESAPPQAEESEPAAPEPAESDLAFQPEEAAAAEPEPAPEVSPPEVETDLFQLVGGQAVDPWWR